ncbi:hypothetical protein LMG31506_04084 [Cupriavidus yeoncheonensis]|uniref:Uncharacterized protein n=1 Tax=Cupriavidus yeoncheonensis TaxID=1462994 RepID=A0A916IVF4_9BURK|nr:hypothetical protein [Cupriavidus yeoncheonensis]CAG2149715.1 hypothetical protein LMG31506_04084 [Cupriavidus yeoncheonensis]
MPCQQRFGPWDVGRRARRRALCGWLGLIGLHLLAATLPTGANAQTLSEPRMADSVVSRLVAWRTRSDQPVALAALTSFDWESFSVTRAPAGDAMANCGRAGLLPCGPELQPEAGQMVQVLSFQRGGRQVYAERIMAENGAFAEPLPVQVPRAAATLMSCRAGDGRPLWCVQGVPAPRRPQPFLDGG